MLDFQAFIERTFGKWTWRPLTLVILVICACIGLIDVARATWFPAPRFTLADGKPFERWRHRDDSRTFVSGAAIGNPGANDGVFDLAWISGSPLSITDAPPDRNFAGRDDYEMTDVLARYLTALGDERVRIQEFLLSGVRTGDMRRAVLFAADQPEIDAYIVELNSVWALNDFLQFTISRQRAFALGLEDRTTFDLLEAAAILRPNEIGLWALSNVVPLVRDRYDFAGRLPVGRDVQFPFRKPEAKVADGSMVWFWQRTFTPALQSRTIPDKAASLRSYRASMLMGDLDEDSISMQTLAANLETLTATGRPVLLIMPPINPLLKDDPETIAYFERLEAAVRREMQEHAGPNIEFYPDLLWAVDDPRRFHDIIHLNSGQDVIDRVVALVESEIGEKFTKVPADTLYDPPAPSEEPANASQ